MKSKERKIVIAMASRKDYNPEMLIYNGDVFKDDEEMVSSLEKCCKNIVWHLDNIFEEEKPHIQGYIEYLTPFEFCNALNKGVIKPEEMYVICCEVKEFKLFKQNINKP